MSKVIAHSTDCGDRTKDVTLQEDVSFESMFLSKKVMEGLTASGFQKPSPIQLKAIPLGRCGFDLIVKSKSGTGKTIVFSLIALEMVDPTNHNLQVLILAPTREIAVQIADVISNVGKAVHGLKVGCFIGGLPEKDDIERAENCHIAVGAPGRVKALIKQKILKVDALKLFVLDEADKLMDNNFQNDINEIYNSLPVSKQMLATSATFSDELKLFLSNYMQSATEVSAEIETPLLLGLKQFVKEVKPSSNAVQEMKNKNEVLLTLLASISFTQCLIFSNYQSRAETISLTINRQGWNSAFISGAQSQTQRLEAIDNLKNFKCRVLLSTDLTARGIDAANVDLIINYDIPIDVQTYLHRMGRAGRYGSKGMCISLISGKKDMMKFRKFLGYIGGTQLTVSKLPEMEEKKIDLWGTDQREFEQVAGIIEENNMTEEAALNIKNEVVGLKGKKCEKGGDEIIAGSKQIHSKEVNKSINRNKNDNTIIGENTLKDLSSLNINERNLEPNVEIDADDSTVLLESMAKGMFDFNNKSCSENIHDKIDSVEDKKRKRITEVTDDQNSILESLVEKTFDFSKILGEDDVKMVSADNSTLEQKEDMKKRKTCSLKQNNMCEGENKIFIKNKALYETAKILTNVTKNIDSDVEKNVTSYFNFLKNDDTGAVTQCLNKNDPSVDKLLNISSPFSGEGQNITDSDQKSNKPTPQRDENLDNIFVNAYRFAIEDTNHWKDFVPEVELKRDLQENQIKANESESNGSEDNESEDCLDDYEELDFEECPGVQHDENGKRIYTYEHIPNRMVWLPVETSVLDSNNEETQVNLLDNEENTCEEEVEDQSESILTQTINTEKDSNVSSHFTHSSSESNINKLAQKNSSKIQMHISNTADHSLPMDSNSLRDFNYEHFTACFKQCSDELWQDGWRFNSVSDFDNWFYSWQQNVQHVSDYVRQNIYIKEMSGYQNSVRK